MYVQASRRSRRVEQFAPLTGEARVASLIFVLGMLRSGTTLMAQMLGQHPEVFAAGELANFWLSLEGDASCQCGAKVARCPIWGEVQLETEAKTGLAAPEAERLRGLAGRNRHLRALQKNLRDGRLSSAERDYAVLRSALLDSVLAVSGARSVVDTSKRAIDLVHLAASRDTVAVHVTRNPFHVAASESDRARWAHIPEVDRPPSRNAMKSAALWSLINAQSQGVSRTTSARFLQFRVEEVLQDPLAPLEAIVAAAGLKAHEWMSRPGEFFMPDGHIVNGNPSRGDLGWQPMREPDSVSRLGRFDHSVVRVLSAPNRRFGYPVPPLLGAAAKSGEASKQADSAVSAPQDGDSTP